jgi:hypothetical protein
MWSEHTLPEKLAGKLIKGLLEKGVQTLANASQVSLGFG